MEESKRKSTIRKACRISSNEMEDLGIDWNSAMIPLNLEEEKRQREWMANAGYGYGGFPTPIDG